MIADAEAPACGIQCRAAARGARTHHEQVEDAFRIASMRAMTALGPRLTALVTDCGKRCRLTP